MIDFNDPDLKDLSDDQKKILDDLVKEIANWRCNNNIEQDRKLSNNEASQFTEWLQNKIRSPLKTSIIY